MGCRSARPIGKKEGGGASVLTSWSKWVKHWPNAGKTQKGRGGSAASAVELRRRGGRTDWSNTGQNWSKAGQKLVKHRRGGQTAAVASWRADGPLALDQWSNTGQTPATFDRSNTSVAILTGGQMSVPADGPLALDQRSTGRSPELLD
jgi:hypothetical protein